MCTLKTKLAHISLVTLSIYKTVVKHRQLHAFFNKDMSGISALDFTATYGDREGKTAKASFLSAIDNANQRVVHKYDLFKLWTNSNKERMYPKSYTVKTLVNS